MSGHLGTSRMEVLSEPVPIPSYPGADHTLLLILRDDTLHYLL